MSPDVFELKLQHAYFMRYVCSCEYGRWVAKDKKLVEAVCPSVEMKLVNWSSLEVFMHGGHTTFQADTMIMLTVALCIRYPTIIPSHSRGNLLKHFTARGLLTIALEGEGAVLKRV